MGFEHWPLSRQCQETLHDPSTLYQVHVAVVGRQEKRLAMVAQLLLVLPRELGDAFYLNPQGTLEESLGGHLNPPLIVSVSVKMM